MFHKMQSQKGKADNKITKKESRKEKEKLSPYDRLCTLRKP